MALEKDNGIIAIIGVGLIGGSFGLALRAAGFKGELLGVSSAAALEAGLRMGAISRKATLEEAAGRADLIYLAQPVDGILKTLCNLRSLIRPGCLVSDAGSTKLEVVRTAAQCLPAGTFLGGHPMAGKERRGVEAADAQLFRGRPYVLTPDGNTRANSFDEFRNWLDRIGARVVEMSAAEHDSTVAFTSHLPQFLSTTLAHALQKQDNIHFEETFGPGLLDMTRLALSDSDLWKGIFATNKKQIRVALDGFRSSLDQLGRIIEEEGDIEPFFQSAAKFARRIRGSAGEV